MKSITDLPHTPGSDKEVLEKIAVLNRGIGYNTFHKIYTEFPFTLKQWAHFLHTNIRTLQRWKQMDAVLPGLAAETLIETYTMAKLGIEVFGNKGFIKWLDTEIEIFDNKKPITLMTSISGIQLIKNKLGRIQHGVLA